MSVKKNSNDVSVKTDRELIINLLALNKNQPAYFKDFNYYYETFCDLNDKEELSGDEKEKRLECGVDAAIIIADSFDLNHELIKPKRHDYIEFARNILYEAGGKPNNDARAMIYLIKALYAHTNLAYSHTNEHKLINIQDGNEWVEYLEKNTKNGVLKAYALTLRAFQYIVNGEALNMSVKDRINKSEKDLIYATKWDEDNYYAYYALGLIYLDNGNSKYNKDKALENFKKVASYENEFAQLDKYLTDEEKSRAMNNAKNKIKILSN